MKNLLSKEHYRYKINTSLMESMFHPFYGHPCPIWITPVLPHLLQETLGPPVYAFSKISDHALNKGGSLYDIYNCI